MKILFTGGGTAGHIFPIIAIIREIKKRSSNGEKFKFFYIGPKDKFVLDLLLEEDVTVKTIFAGKIRRYFSFYNVTDIIFKIPISFLQAFYYVFVISPDLIFSKGGYGSLSTVLMGKILSTPIFIHESDVYPGISNQIGSKFALEVFTGFPIRKNAFFPPDKIICVGNPVREEITKGSLEKAKEIFSIRGKNPLVLVLGGSQGSQKINNVLLSVLADMLENFEVIHQTGVANFQQVKKETDFIIPENLKFFYHPVSFLKDKKLASAYAAADIVVSRAGAGTIFEIAIIGKPSILVPLKGSANEHQVRNAYSYAETGASIVMEEENFRPHFFLEKLKFLFSRPDELKKMSEKAKSFTSPNSARIIAEYIIAYLEQ